DGGRGGVVSRGGVRCSGEGVCAGAALLWGVGGAGNCGKNPAAEGGQRWNIAMSKLVTQSRFPDPDAASVALMEARRGLSDGAAADLVARLVLILASHISDLDVLNESIALPYGGE